MNRRQMLETVLATGALGAAATADANGSHDTAAPGSQARERLRKALEGTAGKEVSMVEVTYPPGSDRVPIVA